MEVVKPPNPIQRVELDRLAVLNSFFPTELPFSSDIQQLILDFVFHRKSCEKIINGDKGWIRLSPLLKDDKLCYEIKFYNERISETISTYSIAKFNFALMGYDLIWDEKEVKDWNWCWIAYWNDYKLTMHVRYVFCPKDDRTYRIEITTIRNEEIASIRIIKMPDYMPGSLRSQFRYDNKDLSYVVIGDLDRFEKGQFAGYQEMVVLYGDDWSKYPKVTETSKMLKDYETFLYSWPGDDE